MDWWSASLMSVFRMQINRKYLRCATSRDNLNRWAAFTFGHLLTRETATFVLTHWRSAVCLIITLYFVKCKKQVDMVKQPHVFHSQPWTTFLTWLNMKYWIILFYRKGISPVIFLSWSFDFTVSRISVWDACWKQNLPILGYMKRQNTSWQVPRVSEVILGRVVLHLAILYAQQAFSCWSSYSTVKAQ